MPSTYSIRILHISDVHFRSAEGSLPEQRIQQVRREEWRRYRVLGEAWVKNIDEIVTSGRPVDIVCMTGDVADWGLPQEYLPATKFLKQILSRFSIGVERLFVVPGNHDIYRKTEEEAWTKLREAAAKVSSHSFSDWMAGGQAPFGVDPTLRDTIFNRSSAYHEWIDKGLSRPDLHPSRSSHGRLGYRSTLTLANRPFPIHIVGLDSAWLAGDEHDAGKLRVTEDQVGILAADGGHSLDGLRIALIHHPLTDLADGAETRRLLAERVDLLLRGHQHDPLSEMWVDPERQLIELAAGCLYEGGEGHRFPNAFQLIDVTTNEQGRPLKYDIWFRSWSPKGHWLDDASLYKEARNGRFSFTAERKGVTGVSSGAKNHIITGHEERSLNSEQTRESTLEKDPTKDSTAKPETKIHEDNKLSRPIKRGNVLGELTGETDRKMLGTAFYESSVFHELLVGNDYRFIVGRRGAGKSALFQKVHESLKQQAKVHLLTEKPQEDTARALQGKLRKISGSYSSARHVARLTWKLQILTAVMEKVRGHYKIRDLDEIAFFDEYKRKHQAIFNTKGMERGLLALESVIQPDTTADELPRTIAIHFQLTELQRNVGTALQELGHRVVLLYDGLDEGWIPEAVDTGVLGGLAKAAVELREADLPIHCTLFVRDNMLRALAYLDSDYTRNIEGNTLRLQWDEESLFRLIVKRLRAAFGWAGDDMKVWNHFAQRDLQGKNGFRLCLQHTLYRPRDVIALLNTAYQVAWQAGRESIIESDLEATAARISRDRLNDLFKEYDRVLPGLQTFSNLFIAKHAVNTLANVQAMLADAAEGPLTGSSGKDFALLNTGAEIFSALYSVGFLGVKEEGTESFRFCHDGSNADLRSLDPSRQVVIHPCYWKALEIDPATMTAAVIMRVDDSDDIAKKPSIKNELTDRRTKLLGDTVAELHKIRPNNEEDDDKFSRWVHRSIQLLFGEQLDGVESKPNPDAPHQRDVLATIKAERGFWTRVNRDYGVRHCVFGIKNVDEVGLAEFQQIWNHINGMYGRLAFIVRHGPEKGLSKTEKRWVREGLKEHDKMVVILSASFLKRALSKMRNELKDEYSEDKLHTLLSQLERS